MNRKIGVSILSFLPAPFLPGGYAHIAENLKSLGLGVQLIPLRKMNKTQDLKNFDVYSFEGPWRFGSFKEAFQRWRTKDSRLSSFVDWSLFGTEEWCKHRMVMLSSLFPEAYPIDIPWHPNSLIELGPEMHFGTARNWKNLVSKGIVIDTEHWLSLRREHRYALLEQHGGIAKVKMVHLKISRKNQLRSFLNGCSDESRILEEFLSHDKEKKIPLIIELDPRLIMFSMNTKETLKKIKNRVQDLVG